MTPQGTAKTRKSRSTHAQGGFCVAGVHLLDQWCVPKQGCVERLSPFCIFLANIALFQEAHRNRSRQHNRPLLHYRGSSWAQRQLLASHGINHNCPAGVEINDNRIVLSCIEIECGYYLSSCSIR